LGELALNTKSEGTYKVRIAILVRRVQGPRLLFLKLYIPSGERLTDLQRISEMLANRVNALSTLSKFVIFPDALLLYLSPVSALAFDHLMAANSTYIGGHHPATGN
jgi:hypothetical protein